MNYPFWEVPWIGGGLVVGIVSIIHVFNSHFAVGGGAYLALTEHLAYRNNDTRLYAYLKKHSTFFLLITTVLGVVSGPGIWWAISLASPQATATLIQQFALLWAFEYVVFLVELATFFVYYYTWDKIPRKTHLGLAWAYFAISILTLVTINGMLTFMLTPGGWVRSHNWVEGYFNPTYWPSNLLRLLIMLGIAGMFALVTSARLPNTPEEAPFRTRMLRYASKWLLPVFFLGPWVGAWYFTQVPPETLKTIETGIQQSGAGNFSILARVVYLSLILSGTLLVFAFVGPFLNPRKFKFSAAVAFLVLGLTVTATSEWVREMLRKPYLIYGYLYSNSLRREMVATVNENGYFPSARFAQGVVLAGLAALPAGSSTATASRLKTLEAGRWMYQYQCLSCHNVRGYRSTVSLLGGRDLAGIRSFLALMRETDAKKNPYHGMMPPLVGSDAEVEALAQYLAAMTAAATTTTTAVGSNAPRP